jgi:hypothetical protein
VSGSQSHERHLAALVLKMARATSDPRLAARLIQVAADFKDKAGELPTPASSPKALGIPTKQ